MSHLDPTKEQFEAVQDLPADEPVMMINLLRFLEQAGYAEGDPEHGDTPPGAEAYKRYMKEAAPFFEEAGGSQIWVGKPEVTVIGPTDENWDLAFIARYPTPQAFVDMVKNPGYQKATRHRTAAVVDSRLICCAEGATVKAKTPSGSQT